MARLTIYFEFVVLLPLMNCQLICNKTKDLELTTTLSTEYYSDNYKNGGYSPKTTTCWKLIGEPEKHIRIYIKMDIQKSKNCDKDFVGVYWLNDNRTEEIHRPLCGNETSILKLTNNPVLLALVANDDEITGSGIEFIAGLINEADPYENNLFFKYLPAALAVIIIIPIIFCIACGVCCFFLCYYLCKRM
ncbi:DgyrCDS14631 [Dimorphilus gyrociliatus]|uniref:DgyrCDS14631 n=1 Tax=Dimorphilus gyrociliatus TaxID=2664684 RepID=A0A7I8WEJ9_9ANNE|nr:DgyrCDS14631 [Dimorphilus gyrociliatus]